MKRCTDWNSVNDQDSVNDQYTLPYEIHIWLDKNGLASIDRWSRIYSIPWNYELVCDNTIESVYRVLKWAHKLGYQPKRIQPNIYRRIIDVEHYAFLKLLNKMKIKFYGICNYAANTKKFQMMKYMINNYFEYSKEVTVIYQLYKKVTRLEKKLSEVRSA